MSHFGPSRPARRALVAASLVTAALTGAACSSSGQAAADRVRPRSAPSSSASASASASKLANVAIDTFMFMPKLVRVHVGDTVVWTNKDSIGHTVTSGTRDYDPTNSGLVVATHADGTFDSLLDGRGATARHTFATPGTFHYFCNRHPGMEADVAVS